jgi:hypothetical protein
MLSLKTFGEKQTFPKGSIETRNESTYHAQNWRIRPGESGVYCHTSSLRSVWLAQTGGARSRHRLSLLLATNTSPKCNFRSKSNACKGVVSSPTIRQSFERSLRPRGVRARPSCRLCSWRDFWAVPQPPYAVLPHLRRGVCPRSRSVLVFDARQ